MGKYRDAWLLIQKQLQHTKQNRELFELIDECVLTYEDIYDGDTHTLTSALDALNLTFQKIHEEERTLEDEDEDA